MNNSKILFLIVFVFLFLSPLIHADDSSITVENEKANSSQEDRWQFTFIPYLWLPSIDARATVHGKTQKVMLFDHETDPNETRNVAAEHPETVERLTALMKENNRG